MNWKNLAIATGALIILPLSTYAAQSQVNNIQETNDMGHLSQRAKQGKRGGDKGQKMNRLLQQLDLTPEQSQQIEAIQEQSQTTGIGLKEQLQTQRQTMKSLLASDATAEQIRGEHQKTQELHQQLDDNRFETMLQIREVLTAEQRTEMTDLMESHRPKFDS